MLILVNEYGLSHVCALPEFENIGKLAYLPYNFPYLDIYFPSNKTEFDFPIEFYYRGTKD